MKFKKINVGKANIPDIYVPVSFQATVTEKQICQRNQAFPEIAGGRRSTGTNLVSLCVNPSVSVTWISLASCCVSLFQTLQDQILTRSVLAGY